MKLLYLYIGHMDRPLDYHEISFSNDFQVHFDRQHRKLLIRKNPEVRRSIYGDNILDLKLIVGKNGCGKSTILNLLGLVAHDLRREFWQYEDENDPWTEKAHDWFALYHLEDNLFALEGYKLPVLLDVSSYVNTHYSVSVRYDFQTHELELVGFLQDARKKETGQRYVDQLAYLSYRLEPDAPWYARSRRQKYEKYDHAFFGRYDISQFNYYGVEHFLYLAAKNEENFRTLFENVPSALKVELRLTRNEIDGQRLRLDDDPLAEAIYGEGRTFLSVSMPQLPKMFHTQGELNYKHSMIIRYLEELLVYSLSEENVKNDRVFTVDGQTEEEKYRSRKDFLLDFIRELTQVPAGPDSYKDTIMHPNDFELAKEFCTAMEQIPDHFFRSGDRAEIYLKDCEHNFLEELMRCYDDNQENEMHEINHRAFLFFTVENLSTGELAMIDLYAAILNGVNWNQQRRNLILLLDEPDSRLHPEWARLFLKRLTELLVTEPFSGYHFQIIIATHSPLPLSDVSKKDIICLQQTEKGIEITEANYGFMSNLNDILLDSMFLTSPFGAFAEQYTNNIIKRISELKKSLEQGREPVQDLDSQTDDLQKDIDLIDDSYIRETLQRSLDFVHLYNSRQPAEARIAYLEKELARLRAVESGKAND